MIVFIFYLIMVKKKRVKYEKVYFTYCYQTYIFLKKIEILLLLL